MATRRSEENLAFSVACMYTFLESRTMYEGLVGGLHAPLLSRENFCRILFQINSQVDISPQWIEREDFT